MAIRLFHATLGLFLIAGLAGCKEGHRHYGLPDGQCLIENADGRLEVVPCRDGQTTPDATLDSTVPDATADAEPGDAGTDAFVLPMNACQDDIGTEVDAGMDGGAVSAIEAAQAVAEMTSVAVGCAAGGLGDEFILCIAARVIESVPQLSQDCATCFGAGTQCAVVNCAAGDNDACLFANPESPTAEELADCNRCRCDNGCYANFDTCAGFAGPASANNAACVPTDGCVDESENVAPALGNVPSAAGACFGMGLTPPQWEFVVCLRDQLLGSTSGLGAECSTCVSLYTQCIGATGCIGACQNLSAPSCQECACQNGCAEVFDSCSGLDFVSACSAGDAGTDASVDGSVDAGADAN